MTKEELIKELEEIKFNATISVKRVYYPAHANCEDDGEVYYVEKDIEYTLFDYANHIYTCSPTASLKDVMETVMIIYKTNKLYDDLVEDDIQFQDYLEERYGEQ